MRRVLLPAVFLLVIGCGSTAGKTGPGLQARTKPLDDAKAVSREQISAVVRNKANMAALRSCYERALKMDNQLTRGRVDVTVSIGTSGTVQRVVTKAPSSFGLVEPCIKGAVKRWVFPPSPEEYATNFPLILQGGM
jgi:outer membrane biosynthesis protein TonB